MTVKIIILHYEQANRMSLENVIQSIRLWCLLGVLRKVAPGLFSYTGYSGNRTVNEREFYSTLNRLCVWKKSDKPENIVGRDYNFLSTQHVTA